MGVVLSQMGVPIAARGRGGLLVLGSVSQAVYQVHIGSPTDRLHGMDFLVIVQVSLR